MLCALLRACAALRAVLRAGPWVPACSHSNAEEQHVHQTLSVTHRHQPKPREKGWHPCPNRQAGRQRLPACNSSGNSSNMCRMCGPINEVQVFHHSGGYVNNVRDGGGRTTRGAENFVRHCKADHCLHLKLMHFLQNIGREGRGYSHF